MPARLAASGAQAAAASKHPSQADVAEAAATVAEAVAAVAAAAAAAAAAAEGPPSSKGAGDSPSPSPGPNSVAEVANEVVEMAGKMGEKEALGPSGPTPPEDAPGPPVPSWSGYRPGWLAEAEAARRVDALALVRPRAARV